MNIHLKMRRLLSLVGLCALMSLTTACDNFKWGHIGYNTGYKPEQPLPFSHKLHAGDYKVPCLYCHTGPEVSKQSAVPSLNICMNCHTVVAAGKPTIQALSEKYNAGQSVNWVKVHMLPDHVKFNHQRHVLKLANAENRQQACQTCHGQVDTMDKIQQVQSLSMGWCVNCHREPQHNASTNCSTCHY